MATQQLQKQLRVLCLHGFRTNAKVMENQTRTLRKVLGDKADFVFLDGPFEAEGPTDASIERAHGKDAPFYEWSRIKSAEDESGENLNAATALTSTNKEWRFNYVGLDRTFELLDEQLRKHGPFDVVLGFSQGATVATSLTMQYLQHNVRWWNLLVCIGGVPVRGLELQHLFEKPDGEPILVPFPSIHIMGKKDPLYTESIKLAAMYEPSPEGSKLPKIVLEHDGGHRFPSAAHNPGFYEHLASIIEQHCGIAPVSKM
ncbi:Serine hydrolase [Globisporangium polare]